MAAPKLWPNSIRPNSGSVGPWIDWGQSRTISAGRTVKVADFGRYIWRYRMVFNRRTDVQARQIETMINSLNGWLEPFRIPIAHDNTARPGSGTVVITTIDTVGTNLPTNGWSPSNGLVLPKGCFICVTHFTQEPRLFQVQSDVIASGGAATIPIRPGMQIPSGSGEQVHYGHYGAADPALATMMLSDPDEVRRQFSHPVLSDFVIDLEEWWEDRPEP